MSLLKLIDDVWNAEENYSNVCSDEPYDELGNRRRELAFRELSLARRALRFHRENVKLIGRICVQYNLPAGDPCWLAEHIGKFV